MKTADLFNPQSEVRNRVMPIRNVLICTAQVPFTTGGAENPTLTIVSLAIRQADYIAEQMGKNAI